MGDSITQKADTRTIVARKADNIPLHSYYSISYVIYYLTVYTRHYAGEKKMPRNKPKDRTYHPQPKTAERWGYRPGRVGSIPPELAKRLAALDLHDARWSNRAISRALGVADTTVAKYLKLRIEAEIRDSVKKEEASTTNETTKSARMQRLAELADKALDELINRLETALQGQSTADLQRALDKALDRLERYKTEQARQERQLQEANIWAGLDE